MDENTGIHRAEAIERLGGSVEQTDETNGSTTLPATTNDGSNVVELDSAGKPLHGGLKDRAIKRPNGLTYFADQIQPRGHNLRMWRLPRNKAKVIEFAQTAYDGGIRVPISVSFENGKILIEHGETRWLAVKLLEGDDVHNVLDGQTDPKILGLLGCLAKNSIQIPATSAPKGNDIDRLRDTIITNTGQSFSDLELADAIKRFTDYGKNQNEIAELLGGKASGWTQTRVSHIFQLRLAPPKLQELVANEVVTTTAVVEAMREHKDEAESIVLAAVEHAKAQAEAEAARHEAEVREAQAEVERLTAESDETVVVTRRGGKRPIAAVEAQQRRAAEAGEKAEAALRVAKEGPKRVTAREISQAAARRNPGASVSTTTLSRTGTAAFIDAVRFEAQYCPHEPTRDRMNNLLKHYGFPELPPRVDNDGKELPLPEELEPAVAPETAPAAAAA